MDLHEWGTVCALAMSLASLSIVVYIEFLASFKLTAQLDYLCLLRLPKANKSSLLLIMIVDDLLSDNPSRDAKELITASGDIQSAVQKRDRDLVSRGVIGLASPDKAINYNPTPERILRYAADANFALSFYVPLLVSNTGRRHSHVSSLILRITDMSGDGVWIYCPFTNINPAALLDRTVPRTDKNRTSGFFVGFTADSRATTRVDPQFVPIAQTESRLISKKKMLPGVYGFEVLGYTTDGKRVFTTDLVEHELTPDWFVRCFNDSDTTVYLSVDRDVEDAVPPI